VEIDKIIKVLGDKQELSEWTRHGWCRKWTSLAMDALEGMDGLFKEIEAVEIEVSPRYWHTFVAARARDGELYFFDGVGYYKNSPYFGAAKDAPVEMQKFRRDGILMTEREINHKSY